MKTVLVRQGDKYILELDRETIEQWAIDPECSLEMTSMGGVLTVTPAGDAELSEKIKASLSGLMDRYDETFKKLAK